VVAASAGLVVSVLASGTQDCGVRTWPKLSDFSGRKNPQLAFLRRGSKAARPMSQICGMLKNPAIYVEVGITGPIERQFLA
jgi:hypothetical protein